VKIADGSQGSNKVLTSDAAGNASWQTAPGTQICFLKDVKGNGSNGGTFTSGAWLTRTLNTIEGSTGLVTLLGNQFTLQAGTYIIEAEAPAYAVSRHQAKLRNVTDGIDLIMGLSSIVNITSGVQSISTIKGMITLAGSKTFEIQHRCETTSFTLGLGAAGSFGVNEVYTQVKITKIN
jgi:hypothetical protein